MESNPEYKVSEHMKRDEFQNGDRVISYTLCYKVGKKWAVTYTDNLNLAALWVRGFVVSIILL